MNSEKFDKTILIYDYTAEQNNVFDIGQEIIWKLLKNNEINIIEIWSL